MWFVHASHRSMLALYDTPLYSLHTYLFEREQLLVGGGRSTGRCVRSSRAIRSHFRAAVIRVLHLLAAGAGRGGSGRNGSAGEGQLFAAMQSGDLLADVLGHFLCGVAKMVSLVWMAFVAVDLIYHKDVL